MKQFWQFLIAGNDDEIWWWLEDAIKLAAGFVPGGEHLFEPGALLRAPSDREAACATVLAEAFDAEPQDAVGGFTAVHDGRRRVKAADFLEWASRIQSFAQGELEKSRGLLREEVLFAKLRWSVARSRRKMRASVEDSGMPPPFEPLTAAVLDLFDRRFLELPEDARERVRSAIGPMEWEMQTADERRDCALDWDYRHDPFAEKDRERADGIPLMLMNLHRKISRLETMESETLADQKFESGALKALRDEARTLALELEAIKLRRSRYLNRLAGFSAEKRIDEQETEKCLRQDDLAIELEGILDQMIAAGEPVVASSAMHRLRARAGTRGSCIIKSVPEGVVWVRVSSKEEQTLTSRNLTERIKRWKRRVRPS